MANAIEVRFAVAGVQEIDRAFRTVQQAAERLERGSARAYDNDARAAQRASREKERENARADRERERAAAAHEREQIKLTEKSVAAVAKAAADKIKIEERWAKESLKFAHAASLEKQRIIERELANETRMRERHARAIGSMIQTSIGSAMSRSTSTLASGATGLAGMALSLGGGISISGILEQRKALERQAALFSNQTSTDAAGRVPVAKIMANAKAIGLANNVNPNDVVGGMNAYFAKTGDVSGSLANAKLFAQLASATGSDVTQLGGVAGALRVQNPNLDDRAMRAMMLNIVGQTRTGAVDIVDLVKHVPVITSTASLYGGDQADNQRKLIGLSQVAMRTSGSSAEASSAVSRLGSNVSANADKIRAHLGVNVKNKDGTLRDASDIVAEMMAASGGDIGKLKKAGIGLEAMRVFTAEEQTFRAAGGGKGGADAVRKDIKRFEEGGYTEASLQADVSTAMNTTGAKFEEVVGRLKDSIEQKMVPYLERFADKFPEIEPKIERIIDGLSDAAEFLTDHPFAAIFALISANIAADVAKAAIGDAIKRSILGGPGGAGGGGAPSPGQSAAAAGGWFAAFYGGEHLLESGGAAYNARQNDRNLAASAHTYLDQWQSGSAGWIGGAKWNPLVSGANIITGLLSDAGEVKAGPKYDGQDLAALADTSRAKRLADFGTGTGTKHAYDDGASERQSAEVLRVLKSIDSKTGTGSGVGGPAAPNRTTSMSNRPTGAQ